jgi:3-hydroxyisobutyrate dehydrogenase
LQRIGFIGIGVMGMPMAEHLLAAGYSLTAHDMDETAVARLKNKHPNVRVGRSPKEVAIESDVVITMLPTGRHVQETVSGPNGLAEGFEAGGLLLDTSSSEPWNTTETAKRLAAIGAAMVDAPVSGAEMGAKKAELIFMVGGATADVGRVRPLLDVMGKQIFHVGPVGAGHAMKSINNLITAATFLATAEGLVMGRAYGLDPSVMTDVLNVATGMSWITKTHIAQRILTRRFDDPFKLDLMVKDIDIALKLAGNLDLDMPHSESTRALWHEVQMKIPKGSSVSELVRAVEKRTGVELKTDQPRDELP